MYRYLMFAALVGCLCGCATGGGSAAPAPVSVTNESLTLHGQVGWPGATTLSLTVDGVATTLSPDGEWSHRINLRGADHHTVRLALIADGVTVAVRDVAVDH